MTKTMIHELADLGQSVWLDHMHRLLLESDGLQTYLNMGVSGVTSNPAIFGKAMAESDIYDRQIQELAREGRGPEETYDRLTFEDCRRAADLLRPIYDATGGRDGFFSLEVDPRLAHDAKASCGAARRFVRMVDRPNLMVKLPATDEGYEAIRTLTAEGLPVNVTLIFSLDQYEQVVEAYLSGLEERAGIFHEVKPIPAVASFFVSRVDTVVDELLDRVGTPEAHDLKGRAAVANARLAYQRYKARFSGERWQRLAEKGALPQRVLYGSTGTKNPAYSDVLYVESLIGPDTINTMPPETLTAFLDHGKVQPTLENDLGQAQSQLDQLAGLGINLAEVAQQLLDEGLEKFIQPYEASLRTIAEKQARPITA